MWARVFGRSAADVPPSALAEHLASCGLPIEPHFKGDEHGWTRGQLVLPKPGAPIQLDRFLTDIDELRAELNTYAAELEAMVPTPHTTALMEHVITTQQLIAIRRPVDCSDESYLDDVITATCQFYASRTDGVYQIDGQGWYSARGEQLVPEY